MVGVWDTLTQAGGGNTELFGVCKTSQGVICVGRQTADGNGAATGNNIPVTNVPLWGSTVPQNETAILVYYQAANLYDPNDSPFVTGINQTNLNADANDIMVYPNPASTTLHVSFSNENLANVKWRYVLTDMLGRTIEQGDLFNNTIDCSKYSAGPYLLQLSNLKYFFSRKIVLSR